MALTDAERQANRKTRQADLLENLSKMNESLVAENQKLQLEVKTLTEKAHKLELDNLRLKLKKA